MKLDVLVDNHFSLRRRREQLCLRSLHRLVRSSSIVMADIQGLVQQYQAQFTKASERLLETYNNAPQKIEALKQKVGDVKPAVQSWIDTTQNFLKNAITDMAPIGVDMAFHKTILDMYTLVAVGLLASAVGYVVGGSVLAGLVGMVFSTNYAFVVSLIVLPMATYYYLQKNDMPKEDRLTAAIGSSFASGLLLGFVLNERFLSISSPPMFVVPLSIGMCHAFLGPSMGNQPRTNLLGASIGTGIGLYFAYGLFTGSFGVTFLLWAFVLAGTGFVDYQLKLARMYEGTASLAADEMISITTYMVTGFLLTSMFSSSPPPDDV